MQLLVQIMGGQLDIDLVIECHVLAVRFPPAVKRHFQGLLSLALPSPLPDTPLSALGADISHPRQLLASTRLDAPCRPSPRHRGHSQLHGRPR